jgi:Protein of unknown function (DUF2846)
MRKLMTMHRGLRPQRRLKWASGLLLITAGCVEPPDTAQLPAAAPPVPAGQARIWFYRDWEPSESLNLANIDLNGGYFGSIANGGVFYRDVSPGHYHIAPQSYGQDFSQDKDVDLAAGQQVYCSVASLRSWEGGGDVAVFERDTFYIRLMPPQVAQAAIARNRSGI